MAHQMITSAQVEAVREAGKLTFRPLTGNRVACNQTRAVMSGRQAENYRAVIHARLHPRKPKGDLTTRQMVEVIRAKMNTTSPTPIAAPLPIVYIRPANGICTSFESVECPQCHIISQERSMVTEVRTCLHCSKKFIACRDSVADEMKYAELLYGNPGNGCRDQTDCPHCKTRNFAAAGTHFNHRERKSCDHCRKVFEMIYPLGR